MSITRIQVRRGTTLQWAADDPVLLSGEFGLDTTTGRVRIGDGSGAWSALPELVLGGVASKSVAYSDLTDADLEQDVAFDDALPAGAVALGWCAVAATAFDNAGGTAVVTFDLGHAGDRDAFIDGGALKPAATVSSPLGVQAAGFVGAITPSIRFNSSVNLNTLSQGSATFYLVYLRAF